MAQTHLQLIGKITSLAKQYLGRSREVQVDTTKSVLVVHDGVTQGGHAQAREDLSNVNPATSVKDGKMTAALVVQLGTMHTSFANVLQQFSVFQTRVESDLSDFQVSVGNLTTALAGKVNRVVTSNVVGKLAHVLPNGNLAVLALGITQVLDRTRHHGLAPANSIEQGVGSGLNADKLRGAIPVVSEQKDTVVLRNAAGFTENTKSIIRALTTPANLNATQVLLRDANNKLSGVSIQNLVRHQIKTSVITINIAARPSGEATVSNLSGGVDSVQCFLRPKSNLILANGKTITPADKILWNPNLPAATYIYKYGGSNHALYSHLWIAINSNTIQIKFSDTVGLHTSPATTRDHGADENQKDVFNREYILNTLNRANFWLDLHVTYVR